MHDEELCDFCDTKAVGFASDPLLIVIANRKRNKTCLIFRLCEEHATEFLAMQIQVPSLAYLLNWKKGHST